MDAPSDNAASDHAAPENADRFLVDAVRAGDQAAWRQLIERYHGRLLAFARARTPGLADAEDVVQETFVGFLQSLPNYDPDRALETYLFTIVRYKLIDRMRSRKLNTVGLDSGDDDWWGRVEPSTGETPSRAAMAAESNARMEATLAAVLRQLIEDYRDRSAFEDLQVIELLFFAGWRNLDVAELLEIDQKAVAGIKFRALGKLRRALETDGAATITDDDDTTTLTVAGVWRQRRLTCLKRSTLGAFSLGALEEPWQSYTRFHLDVVACPMCLANLRDLECEERDAEAPQRREHLYASSVGFLSRASQP